ncbi:MAG: T9SS type A sorting domain-containing protein [Candidatus Latescibacteria bacterium]|nr:T9SS type A sorting domain-containing protein [Candidatus Latescibacterota bacterium]
MRPIVILIALFMGGLPASVDAMPASVDAMQLAPSHPATVVPVPTTISDFFLPGSQPGQSGTLEFPSKCDNCHGGYNLAVEPAYNWRGSMMAQAARDPLFYACLAIANQDAPQSGDLCIRCHTPKGWLEGRSEPTDGSALTAQDREGVTCDFCHKMVRPAPLGTNPYPGDADYTAGTYTQDQSYLATLGLIPGTTANGMYIADGNNAKRGPFTDANATHQMLYSPFHREADLCGTCHDVSNPAYTKTGSAYVPNAFGAGAPSFDPYMMFPIERTYSEWKMSAYNQPGGVYAPQFGGNKTFVSTCQDCHMKDVSGVACNKAGGVFRNDLPLHDMTGGNTFIPLLVQSLYPSEVDAAALSAGIQRAQAMLEKAASLDVAVAWKDGTYKLLASVINETGHKLPSGYPEGRRIWLNVKMFDPAGALVYESGAYDPATAVLNHDPDIKVYEIKPGISADLAPVVNLAAGPSFHFAINNQIYSDNRIPPRGFRNSTFAAIQSPPIAYSYADGQHWDDTYYPIHPDAARAEVTLYYQTLSREYVEFLRDENRTNTAGQVLYDGWAANGKSPPVAMATKTKLIDLVTAVESPGDRAPALAVGAARPNPGDHVSVTISLPNAAPAVLDLIDVQGRLVLSRDVGSMGAGTHRVALDPGRRLPSGVYVVRLTQGTRFVTAKAVLAR